MRNSQSSIITDRRDSPLQGSQFQIAISVKSTFVFLFDYQSLSVSLSVYFRFTEVSNVTDRLYETMSPSVNPPVTPSVRLSIYASFRPSVR